MFLCPYLLPDKDIRTIYFQFYLPVTAKTFSEGTFFDSPEKNFQ